jgi:hypothetical protein
MRRFPAILLLIAVATLGSGALRYAHEMAHAAGHSAEAGDADGHGHDHAPSHAPSHAPPHDESNCFVHAMLKLPMLGPGHVPVLVLIGTFIAFLTSLPVAVRCRRPVLLLDSRGPPVA